MAAQTAQQFSLKWNNYSQHIVTALEELRVDDELTDVTLSSEGQRIKAHKVLLSACSVFFKETFKENPCKHPVVILKGISFQELQAVVQFMYNGQVNVTQERLPSFLQAAETLQIKGLTDSANVGDREETKVPTLAKKRPQTFPQQASSQQIDSIRQQDADRPPTPKRKRIIGSTSSTFASAQNSELPGTAPVISATGAGTSNATNNGSTQNSNQSHSMALAIPGHTSENSGDGLPLVKYEDQEEVEDEEYDGNGESFQDNGVKRVIDESDSDMANSLGSGKIRTSGYGTGERRPRYNLQPSSNDLSSATGVVDATNVTVLKNGMTPRDFSLDKGSYLNMNGIIATNGNGHLNSSKLRSRLNSRSLSSGGSYQQPPQQDDRVIKYAPMQNHNGSHNHDSHSNSSHEECGPVNGRYEDDGSESPPGSDDDDDHYRHQYDQRRRSSLSLPINLQQSKTRAMPHLMKTNNSIYTPPQQAQFMLRHSVVNAHQKHVSNNRTSGSSTGSSVGVVEDLSVSSPAQDLSTPSFSLTQQLLQQNVLSLISQNGAEVIKSNGSNGSVRAITVAPPPPSSASSSPPSGTCNNGSGNGMSAGEQPPLIAPYVCDICGKRYVHHRSLNDHKKSHTGATRCPVCNKSFSKVANMRAHYAAQHQTNDNSSGSSSGDININITEDNHLNGHVSLKSSA